MAFSIVKAPLVESTVDPALQETSSKKQLQQQKKSVRFSETRKVFYRNRGQSSVPKNELWYASEDYLQFRANFTQDAKQVARSMKRAGEENPVLNAFYDCQEQPLVVPKNAALQKFFQDPARTGLERMAAREIFSHKSRALKQQRKCVMDIQSGDLPYFPEAKMIRTACRQASRSSATFAQCVAIMGQR